MKVIKDKRSKRARSTPSDSIGGPDIIQRKTHVVTIKGSEVLVVRLKGNVSHELVVEKNTVGDFCYLKQGYLGPAEVEKKRKQRVPQKIVPEEEKKRVEREEKEESSDSDPYVDLRPIKRGGNEPKFYSKDGAHRLLYGEGSIAEGSSEKKVDSHSKKEKKKRRKS